MRLRSARQKQAAADLPKATGKAASALAGLLESGEVRRASGARAHDPDFGTALVDGILGRTGRDLRTDVPRPVHVPAPPRRPVQPGPSEEFLASLDDTLGGTEADGARRLDPDQSADDEFIWPTPPKEDDA